MTTTVNGSDCYSQLNPTAEQIGKTFAYCLILVVSLLGNSFIAIIVYRTRTLRKPINFFIVNMAMSDLLCPIFYIPFTLAGIYVDSWLISGPLGEAVCKLYNFLSPVSSFVSIESLVLIALDRYKAVVFPLRPALISSKLCPFFILATWIVALGVCSTILFAVKLVEYPSGQLMCEWRWNEAFGESLPYTDYFLALCVVFLYIPIVLLSILYCIILIKLKTQIAPGEQLINAEKIREKRNRNVINMAIAIVIGFVLCWVPWSIIDLLTVFAWNSRLPCGVYKYGAIVWVMADAYCAVNPVICFVFSKNYRQGLKRLFNCCGAMQV